MGMWLWSGLKPYLCASKVCNSSSNNSSNNIAAIGTTHEKYHTTKLGPAESCWQSLISLCAIFSIPILSSWYSAPSSPPPRMQFPVLVMLGEEEEGEEEEKEGERR